MDVSAVGRGTVMLDAQRLHRAARALPINGGAVPAAARADRRPTTLGQPPPSAAEREAEPAAQPNQTVLVVEDESSIASFVALYLKNAGYSVRTAATGSEALAQFQASRRPR